MRSIISACILAVCIAAQGEEDTPMVISPPDQPRACSNGQVGGCLLPPKDDEWNTDDKPDRLCAVGDLGCRNHDAGKIDPIDRDDLPDRLCANGQWGCHNFDDGDKDDGSVINIYDDWFNSAVGLKTATLAAIASSSALMLAF